MRKRIAKEIQHGRFLAAHGAGEIWNWESPAGKLRWSRRVKMLSSHLEPGMSVLEVGCGTGYFTRELARLGSEVIAIDVSPELLEIATANCSMPNVRYEIQDASALSYSDAMFDSVVGSSVLHHLEIKEALREIYRVLKPGGAVYFTEPNMDIVQKRPKKPMRRQEWRITKQKSNSQSENSKSFHATVMARVLVSHWAGGILPGPSLRSSTQES